MLGRRASLVGALVGAVGVGSRKLSPNPLLGCPEEPTLGGVRENALLNPVAAFKEQEYKRRWELWDKTRNQMMRKARRAQIKQELLGGMPVEAATLGAAKPWFRAQMAARIIEQREWDEKSWFDKKRAEIMGDF